MTCTPDVKRELWRRLGQAEAVAIIRDWAQEPSLYESCPTLTGVLWAWRESNAYRDWRAADVTGR